MECNCTVSLPWPSLAGCGSSSLLLFMLVLEQYLRTQCDIEDPCGQINPRTNPLPTYDFIVVGAGSAGSVVASRLSEMECNCTVSLPGPSLAGCGSSSLLLFMLVMEQYLRTQCDIEDPCGQINPRTDPLPEYDFIVVGVGSAGSVVASVQMECNCTVSLPGPSLAGCGSSSLLLFMLVLEQYLRTQCDIEDPCGQINPRTNPLPQYDFIVVGAGSAGSVVASRLSEVPEWNVLLVEAGVNEPTSSQVPSFWANAQNTSVDWRYITEPDTTAFLNNGGRTTWPRGKVIGGSSVLNGMKYIRGNKRDYDHWDALGNTGWSYEDVLPYFIKSENNLQIDSVDKGYHGVGGYLPVSRLPFTYPFEEDLIEAAKEMGQRIGDINGKSQVGFTIDQTTTKSGVRHSAARSFLRPIQNRDNLHIMLNTFVTRVLIDNETKRAFGIEFIKDDSSKGTILTAREVILCGGAIGSPNILLHSGIGDETLLTDYEIPVIHHLPGVGRNLHDDVGYKVKFNTNQTSINDLNWAEAVRYLLARNGTLSSSGISVFGFIQTKYVNKSEDFPDIRFEFEGYTAECSKTGAIDEIVGNVVDSKIPTRQVKMWSLLSQPKSRGYLTLRDNNPLSYPKLFPKYLSNSSDIPPIIEGIKFLIELSGTFALQKYGLELDRTPVRGCEDYIFGSDSYWECAIRRDTLFDYHEVGTCKMGPDSDPEAVVDPQLRVWGVQGLRVVDASIMPIITNGNTHAPTVMIGEKGSDMIKHQ